MQKNLGSLTNVLFEKVLEVESFLVWLPVAIIEVPDDASLSLSSLLFSLFACRRFPEKSGDKRSFRLFLFFSGIRGMEGGLIDVDQLRNSSPSLQNSVVSFFSQHHAGIPPTFL